MRTVFLFILLVIFSKLSFADDFRSQTLFKSENGKYSFQYFKKKWKLIDVTGKVHYSIEDRGYTSMTIFISNDGQRVVVINDFMQGHRIGQRSALKFFVKGQMIANYKFTDILSDTTNVSFTVWHTGWCLEDYKFAHNDSIFSLATFELTEFEFDTFNGQIKKKRKPSPFDEKTLIVYGHFSTEDGDKETNLTILKYIFGQRQNNNQLHVKFKNRFFNKGSWREIFMIKDNVDVTPYRFAKEHIYVSNLLEENK